LENNNKELLGLDESFELRGNGIMPEDNYEKIDRIELHKQELEQKILKV
jgi:hypothetical protein